MIVCYRQATSDAQALGLTVLQYVINILPTATILKLIFFKSYGFLVTFIICEAWKLGSVFGFGVVNSLVILKLCFILELEWVFELHKILLTVSLYDSPVTKLTDSRQMLLTVIFSLCHNLANLYEYVQVRQSSR